MTTSFPNPDRPLRILHLFPDLLQVYGDVGNVRTLVARAEARGIPTVVDRVLVGAPELPPADIVVAGGGQDREQVTVARELERLGGQLRDEVAAGTAVLAVCGSYQNLGTSYRTADGDLPTPGILDAWTDATVPGHRLVGPVVADLAPSMAALAAPEEGSGGVPGGAPGSVVGFENHGGRTYLGPSAEPLAIVRLGWGNNGVDRLEGYVGLPGSDGMRGLRIGTYLHGPLLPRNPHLADALLSAALGRGGDPVPLAPLDDTWEWRAHERGRERLLAEAAAERRVPGWARRVVDPIRALIGY